MFPGASLEQALHGGEDYELLFTARPRTAIPQRFEGLPLTRIGTMRKRRPGAVLLNGAPLEALGYDHFRETMSLPDPAPILDLIESFRRSKTMFTAVSMGIFDSLYEAPSTAAGLAGELGADAGALERLLDACAALGLLRKEDGVFHNQPVAAEYLRAGSRNALTGYILYSDRALYPMWGNLEDCDSRRHAPLAADVRLGRADFQQLLQDRGVAARIPAGDARVWHADVAGGGRGVRSQPVSGLADLGGASGHLAIAACERYPGLRGIVHDLPQVAGFAREQIAQSTAADRLEVVEGDFFRDELPAADLYAVGQILHDWSDEQVGRLVGRGSRTGFRLGAGC